MASFNGLFSDRGKKRASRHQRPRLGQSLLAGERLEHRAFLSADAAMTHAAMIDQPAGNGASAAIVSSPQPGSAFIAVPPSDQGLPESHPPYSSGWRPLDPFTTPLCVSPSQENTNPNMAGAADSGQPVAGEPTGGYPGPAGRGVYPYPVF